MDLKSATKKMKCDRPGCKNKAEFVLEFKRNFHVGDLYFCKDCLSQMYTLMGNKLVPSSIKNVYKKHEGKEVK